jgi:hypothetical protein
MCQYQGSPVYKHGKASSDRIMGRPAGNGAVPTPKRTMSPDKGTGGMTALEYQELAIRRGRRGPAPCTPAKGRGPLEPAKRA